jgi:hypothetical protein
MREEAIVRKLAERARREEAPAVDVAHRVMTILRARAAAKPRSVQAFAWVAGLSAAAAAPLAAAALSVWHTWSDPLVGVFFQSPWGTP